MATTTKAMTAEELLRLPDDGQRHELIAGELRTMTPTGDEHGGIVAILTEALRAYVRPRQLGLVRTGEPGFLLARNPDTVRAPDVAFVSRERAQSAGKVTGYRHGAPDLAIEIVSPSDLYIELEDKVALWLDHGARMVIVVSPRQQTVAVYRSRTRVRILTTADTLDGEEVVPGWTIPVAAIFEDELAGG